jgi:NADPH-dependent 2,4-dienoyl-CoA reductase/sulfur reductase-like enzyme/nitrite reductase/ring-hydroxylating ferredoxin subunit
MSGDPTPSGPDLRAGYPEDQLKDHGMVLGHVDGEPVLLARLGAVVYAVSAVCPHYGGSLADGVLAGDTIRCPLHHACFDLATGRALRGPALADITCYEVERRLDLLRVRGRLEAHPPARAAIPRRTKAPRRIVIVGSGAAGTAAALALRKEGFEGQLTLIGEEAHEPYDRPNLSKDYLAGTAPEEWLPLLPRARYEDLGIRLTLGTAVARIDPADRTVWLGDGRAFPYDALLLATGATPVRLPVPGADRPHVYTLRNVDDARTIRTRAQVEGRVVVIGTGFLGLEAAAALRQLGVEVQVVGREAHPLERALGPALGTRLQQLHESHGVLFHLERQPREIGEKAVLLDDGRRLETSLVILATGVQPNTDLAAAAGLATHDGILVDRHLETSVPGIFAAGDVARWPDPGTDAPVRFEHWATAERLGETAARNMLGYMDPFEAIPFFWTHHYAVQVSYVGHARAWDRLEILANLPADQWEQRYFAGGTLAAVATIGRDRESLLAEITLEQAVSSARPRRASEPRGARRARSAP